MGLVTHQHRLPGARGLLWEASWLWERGYLHGKRTREGQNDNTVIHGRFLGLIMPRLVKNKRRLKRGLLINLFAPLRPSDRLVLHLGTMWTCARGARHAMTLSSCDYRFASALSLWISCIVRCWKELAYHIWQAENVTSGGFLISNASPRGTPTKKRHVPPNSPPGINCCSLPSHI